MRTVTRKVRKVFRGMAELDECTRDGGIEVARGGARLVARTVVADELGRTNPRATEPFGGRVLVRKQFLLDGEPVGKAVLAPYLLCDRPGARLKIAVNGHPFTLRWPKKREYWRDSWTAIRVPEGVLVKGMNDVVFSGDEGAGWALIVEHARWPRRSAKSLDGGRTWQFDGLGGTGAFLHGEYVVRLQMPNHPPVGTMVSPELDLALLAGAEGIAADAEARRVRVEGRGETPAGTHIALSARFGPSPHYDPATWSPWEPADADLYPPAGAHFVQWRAVLATERGDATPVLRAVTVSADLAVRRWGCCVAVVDADNPPVVRSSFPFAYQRFEEPRLALFRSQWKLDAIVPPGSDDFAAFLALRNWSRHQWEDGWNLGPTGFIPPWDGMIILELASRQLTLGMCTHYATAFVHACVALGYSARTQIMRSHCIAEVWSNALRKWVTLDHTGDMNDARKVTFHFERDGVPQSALEVHRALIDGSWRELRYSPPEAGDAFALEDRVRLYDRFCIHFRNDELSSLEPGEPSHGERSYHYDEYLWWADRRTPPAPWFSRASTRAGDFDWTLNHARIHLAHAGPRALQVSLDTETPNLETFLRRCDRGAWEPCPAAFRWEVHAGANALEVQPRNKFGHPGIVTRVTVDVQDGK